MTAPVFCCNSSLLFPWDELNPFSILRAFDLTRQILPKITYSSPQPPSSMIDVVRKEEEVPEWKRYFSYQLGPPKGLYEMAYSHRDIYSSVK